MALQGPFVVVADSPAPDVVEALRAAGAFPIIETNWPDAVAAIASVEPEAVVLAEPCADRERADEYARALTKRLNTAGGAFTPVIARMHEDGPTPVPQALAISASVPAARIASPARRCGAHSRAPRHGVAPHGDAGVAR